jgi:zinc protease
VKNVLTLMVACLALGAGTVCAAPARDAKPTPGAKPAGTKPIEMETPVRSAITSPSGDIPATPRELKFAPLTYDAPIRTDFRHELSNGVVVYVIEDHLLPLVDVTVTSRAGDWMDPSDKAGLAAVTADQMRSGGAGSLDAAAFDEQIDLLALQMGIGSATRESSASLNSLSKGLDRGLDLLFMALKQPRFEQARLDLYVTQAKQNLERRNDSTTAIEAREWKRLVYGTDHFETRQVTSTSLDAIEREDLVAFHQRAWNPANLVVSVTGDVKTADVLAKLEQRFQGWAPGAKVPEVPRPTAKMTRGVWLVDKPDVNQSRVSIGHLATTWNDPRRPQIEVMNEILGGGGFTSRIVDKVRTDAGLAYSAGSIVGFGREYPQSFRAAFQSANKSVARATGITIGEIERMLSEPVTDEELSTARNSLVESFPQRFASPQAKASIFVNDEILGRPATHWRDYRAQIKAVSKEQVQTVATEFLKPGELAVLIVGKKSEILGGDPDFPDFKLDKYAGPQGVLEVPLPDPSTMVYPSQPKPLS